MQHNLAWRTLVLIGAVLAVTQLGFYFTAAALPLYLHDLGAAQDRIGFEVGLGSLAALAVTLILGPVINRRGAMFFLRLGAALYAATALGMLLIGTEVTVALFRALQGVGSAMIVPSAFVLAARLMPHRSGTALGTLGMLNSAALAAGPPVGLQLYVQEGAGWLFLPAALAAALGFLSSAAIRIKPQAAEAAPGFGFDRNWIALLISMALATMYFGGILAYLPLVLREAHGPNAGIFFTADALGVLLLRVPTGILVDRSGSLAPRLLGLLVSIPGIAVLALSPSIPVLIVAGACTGIGAGLFVTGVMADLSGLSDEANRGTAMSLGLGSFSAAIFVGSAISGLLIGPGGFNAVLLFGILTCLAALPFVWWSQSPHVSSLTPGPLETG